MAEKETIMKLQVNLECEKCCKKVKKLLAKYPREIQEQKFDKKENIVTISVVCCSPEKIRDKLCCKGGGCIWSIEILEPQNPNNAPRCEPNPPPIKLSGPLVQINVNPPVLPQMEAPVRICCGQCQDGRLGGSCMNGYIRPLVCYCGYYGRPICDSCRGGRPYYYACHCYQYFNRNTCQGVQYYDHAHSPHSHHV